MGAIRQPNLTIAAINQKGGVGKSTLAINLAAAAHLSGRRTIVLDLDPQGSALDWFDARGKDSKLKGLGVAGAARALDHDRFAELTSGYEVAVLDGPPRLDEIARAAAIASDVALVPLRPGAFDWWACKDTLELLDVADSARKSFRRQKVRRVFVLNGALERTRLAQSALDALSKLTGEVAPVVIAPRVLFAEATVTGESVLTMAPDGAAAEQVRALWAFLSARAFPAGVQAHA